MTAPAMRPALAADEHAFVAGVSRAGTLANDAFHHRDHLRVAWIYARLYGPLGNGGPIRRRPARLCRCQG